MTQDLSKRRFISLLGATAVSGGVMKHAIAQDDMPQITPSDAGSIHTSELGHKLIVLDGDEANSLGGLKKSINYLVEIEVINDDEAEVLYDIVDMIFSEDALNEIIDKLYDMLEELGETISDIVKSMIEIVISSCGVALELLGDLARSDIGRAIAGDFAGSFAGAGSAAGIWKNPWFITAGAVIGAVSGSVLTYSETSDPKSAEAAETS